MLGHINGYGTFRKMELNKNLGNLISHMNTRKWIKPVSGKSSVKSSCKNCSFDITVWYIPNSKEWFTRRKVLKCFGFVQIIKLAETTAEIRYTHVHNFRIPLNFASSLHKNSLRFDSVAEWTRSSRQRSRFVVSKYTRSNGTIIRKGQFNLVL